MSAVRDTTSWAEQPAELTLREIDTSASVEEIVAGFMPTPRFSTVSFATYLPDPNQPSQAEAVEHLRQYIATIPGAPEPHRGFFWKRTRKPKPSASGCLYLDGGFGVGKTHLLAAAYFAAPTPKAYLSFQELTYTIGALGMQAALAAFSKFRLICIDEFELDDVGNTMLVKTFIRGLLEGPSRFVTTSNTLPSELGQGRFGADDFKLQIREIASAFRVVHIEGEDYRHRPRDGATLKTGPLPPDLLKRVYASYVPATRAKLYTSFPELCDHLAECHPIQYAALLDPLELVCLEDVDTIHDQMVALRFVLFIDKLYDQQVKLALSSRCHLPDLFAAGYRDKGYAKKYQRCLSRLHELLQETSSIRDQVVK